MPELRDLVASVVKGLIRIVLQFKVTSLDTKKIVRAL